MSAGILKFAHFTYRFYHCVRHTYCPIPVITTFLPVSTPNYPTILPVSAS
nr:MAG TPA: hypothetical protein [Caudoviricetes sp.]